MHRTIGKFTYNDESHYAVGVVGLEDVDCDTIDLTYVSFKMRNRHSVFSFACRVRR